MRILSHSESHIVELEDGSRWQIFPGDLDVTLGWTPEVAAMTAARLERRSLLRPRSPSIPLSPMNGTSPF